MSKQPNIVFFFSDQQRWDTLGCYGQKLPVTPNLDLLAAKGVRFENAFTCQPVCGPARACLQTGKYATEVGCFRNAIALPLDEKTIADWLNQFGYETGYVGKWHLASTRNELSYQEAAVPPERRAGYKDHWVVADVLEHTSDGYGGYLFNAAMEKVEFQGYRADKVTDHALDFIRTRDKEQPFFLFLSHIEPHHQNNHNRYEGPMGSKERFKAYEVPGDLQGTEGDWRENYPDYLGCCNSLDQNVGRVMDALSEKGLAENTIFIYTSDHGSHFRTRNAEYKRSCHDGCIRIPMIAYGPGFEGGQVIHELVSLMDIPPTILSAAGIPTPNTMKGRPLQQLASGEAVAWPQEVFVQISESQVGRAIRTAKWKYSVRDDDKNPQVDACSNQYTEDFLYDLEKDPHEKNNLVADPAYRDVREQLAQRLMERMQQAGEEVPVILSRSSQA